MADSVDVRQLMTQTQIQAMLPDCGRFTFPAPYLTQGIRLTNAGDCGGNDCVDYVGYSYWRRPPRARSARRAARAGTSAPELSS